MSVKIMFKQEHCFSCSLGQRSFSSDLFVTISSVSWFKAINSVSVRCRVTFLLGKFENFYYIWSFCLYFIACYYKVGMLVISTDAWFNPVIGRLNSIAWKWNSQANFALCEAWKTRGPLTEIKGSWFQNPYHWVGSYSS